MGTDDEAGGAIDDWGEDQLESEYIVLLHQRFSSRNGKMVLLRQS